jgi:Spy/CpxP family protein refolding chaperone
MKKIIVTTLVLSLVVLGISAGTVDAHGGFGQGSKFQDNQTRPYYQQDQALIDLEEEQLEELTVIREEFFEKREELVNDLQEKRYELRQELFIDESSDRVVELNEEIAELQTMINENRDQYIINMKSVLSDEQIEVLLENEDYRLGVGFGMYNNRQINSFGPHQMGGFGFNQQQSGFNRGIRGGNWMQNRGFCY